MSEGTTFFRSLLGRGKAREPSPPPDPLTVFTQAWLTVQAHLEQPDERMLLRGIASTPVPVKLQEMVDALVGETNGQEENETGACLEYLLKNDVLAVLERISEADRPSGVRAEVLNVFNLLVALLDEKFLVHNAVHRPLRRLLRSCVGDEPEELLDGQARVVGAAAGTAGKGLPSDYEKDLLELMCMLCKRIRSYPSLLMIFFHDQALHTGQSTHPSAGPPPPEDPELSSLLDRVGSPSPSTATGISSSRGEPKKELEFLLFSYLLRFVHRESPIGEFSRAGILFLIDVAFSTGENAFQTDPLADTKLLLAEYILDGDFAEVLGAGLGAVYSLLPSKLTIHNGPVAEPHAGGGMVLGASAPDDDDEIAQPKPAVVSWDEAELSSSPNFQHHLDTFLKFLEFIQDLIKRGHSKSSSPAADTPRAESADAQAIVGQAMSRAIAGCVRSTFLEHVLYPSILESDPTDGSAVAVLSYIDVMLSTLDPAGALAEDLLRFLLADDAATDTRNALILPTQPVQTTAEVKANRRKSSAMILLENLKPSKASQYTSQGRFTLKDLVTDNLASSSASTATAALKLLNTVLSRYATFGLRGLLAVLPDPKAVVVPFRLPALSLSLSADGDDDTDSLFTSRPGSPESDVFVYHGEDAKQPSTPPPSTILSLPDWVLPQPTTTSAVHARETELYLSLVAEINSSDPSPLPGPDSLPSNYANYLHDAQAALSADRSLTSFQLGLISAAGESTSDHSSSLARHFKLNPSDALLRSVLDRLREFFVHTPEENLALTGALASTALSADLSLEGFLAFSRQEEEVDVWAEAERKRSTAKTSAGDGDGNEDEDGKSIDQRLEERSRTAVPRMMRPEELNNPFSTDSHDAQPILYILFRNLVRKLERYRLLVPDFDHYLSERRRGLLFEETMADLLLDVSSDGPSTPSTSIFSDVSSAVSSPFARPRPPTSTRSLSSPSAAPVTPRPVAKSKWSFLSPSKPKTPTPTATPTRIDPATLPYTPRGGTPSKQTPTSTPHAAHYQVTSAMKVERLVAESPKKGVWSPAAAKAGKRGGARAQSGLREERVLGRVGEEDQFGLGSDEDEGDDEDEQKRRHQEEEDERARIERYESEGKKVSLSQVLDNVVILEECLKELVAITVVRLASGVDTMSHL